MLGSFTRLVAQVVRNLLVHRQSQRGILPFGDKVSNAAKAGAAAAIIYNNEPGIFSGRLESASEIPAVSISQEDGQSLLDLLNALSPRPVTLRMSVQVDTVKGESQNVVARPPQGECRLVVGGHYDSVPAGPGANDNGSGTATAIEIARVLAAEGKQTGVCFALFGAEEIGLVGSAYYVSRLSTQEKDALVGMLNFDMLAVGDSWPLGGSSQIVSVAADAAAKLGLAFSRNSAIPANAGSDHASFINAGIPAIIFNCFCDRHYHTADDRFEFVKVERLSEAGALALAIIDKLLKG